MATQWQQNPEMPKWCCENRQKLTVRQWISSLNAATVGVETSTGLRCRCLVSGAPAHPAV